jgi:hypothetical protein
MLNNASGQSIGDSDKCFEGTNNIIKYAVNRSTYAFRFIPGMLMLNVLA